MRSLEESRKRWDFTIKHAGSLDRLKRSVKKDGDDNPCVTGLRSVCWKAFLLFQNTEVTRWSRALKDSRSAYTSLREHFLRYIENPDELGSALDPLDDDQNSPWNTLRRDEEIRAEIFQDVERCMPEEPYFRSPETQRILLDILFIFCKINQDVGYRQGMHEVLAPILWVVEQDAIDKGIPKEPSTVMEQTLDAMYIEHDAFTLLSLIMRSAKSFYELAEPNRRVSNSSGGGKSPEPGASPIVERSKRIHEIYLGRLDPELAKHLSDIEVLPQIFLIRWIRLLFGREFPFEELLALWDTIFAEDPALELVDMVCVAMLLRIRWQLMEANYSFALMLLLKYPSPEAPNGPKSFVDDAIYLRDNFSATGGANIINKYSGKSPPISSSNLRPSTPLGQSSSPKRNTRSPLPSPARFLQQQGGVEALFQGAARGVFDRGERLGINQAVRDAVGEVKKNMQGLQSSRSNSARRTPSDDNRWSLDEGRSVESPRTAIAAINARNQQLAAMLGQAMTDLRAVSVSSNGDKDEYVKAMELAIAKVEFVKVYLEDSTMPLPENTSHSTHSPSAPMNNSQPSAPDPLQITKPEPTSSEASDSGSLSTAAVDTLETPLQDNSIPNQPSPKLELPQVAAPEQPQGDLTKLVKEGLAIRPKAPVPTRSSIAQSSFSWMLEPDISMGSNQRSSPPKSGSPFLKSGRRPTSGPNREKAAFLFGEDGEESNMNAARLPLGSSEEAFNLGMMKGHSNE